MTNYYKAKEGSKAHKAIYDLFNYQKDWNKHDNKLNEFLGFENNKTLYLDLNALTVDRKALTDNRPEWLDQFKKDSYPAVAKANSKINKEWKRLVKELGLRSIRTLDVSLELDLAFRRDKGGYSTVKENYFYYCEGEISQKSIDTGFELIPEYEYLRMKAEALEEKERESK